MRLHLQLSARILGAVGATASLAILIAVVGGWGLRNVESSMAATSAVVDRSIDRQNQNLKLKATLVGFAAGVVKATTISELDRLAASSNAVKSDDEDLLKLANEVAQLRGFRFELLSRQSRLAALDAQAATDVNALQQEVAQLVAALESANQAQARGALEGFSKAGIEQKSSIEAALKDQSRINDGAMKVVVSVLMLRADIFDLAGRMTDVRYIADRSYASRRVDDIRSLFTVIDRHLGEIPAGKAPGMTKIVGELQTQAVGTNGILSQVLSSLADTNSPPSAALAAAFASFDTQLSAANRELLTLVDDAVFDVAIQLGDAADALGRKIQSRTQQSLADSKAAWEAMDAGGRRIKTALLVQASSVILEALLKGVRLADNPEVVAIARTNIVATLARARAELATLEAGQSAPILNRLKSVEATAVGEDGAVPTKLAWIQADAAFAASNLRVGQLVALADQVVIRDAEAMRQQSRKQLANTVATATRTERWLLAVGAGSVAGVILVALMIPRAIIRPLRRLLAAVGDGAERVAHAASQITHTSQSLSQGAGTQASALEQTSASIEQISSMVRQSAENAQSTKSIAGEARHVAEQGARDIQGMTGAMRDIKAANDRVAAIIRTIDEIAFQTNILALNAAVEAARAGDAGTGFAVVAEEVRRLAQRSAQAARETAAGIEDSIQKSEHGVRLTGQVASEFDSIVTHARRVDELVGQIAHSSAEQNRGISQLNSGLVRMDEVTQSAAASAVEAAASAEVMNEQAQALRVALRELLELVGEDRPTGSGANRSAPATPIASQPPSRPRLPSPVRLSSPRQPSTAPSPRRPRPAPLTRLAP